jgi:hypothetical protein
VGAIAQVYLLLQLLDGVLAPIKLTFDLSGWSIIASTKMAYAVTGTTIKSGSE